MAKKCTFSKMGKKKLSRKRPKRGMSPIERAKTLSDWKKSIW